MQDPTSSRRPLFWLSVIAATVTAGAGGFAATAGWLSPNRLTPDRLLASLEPPGGPALGHRRNHAKGICFTGVFEANGEGAAFSRARVLAAGRYPVLGRFNLSTNDPNAADATARVRGLGLQISTPGGDVWRMALIDPPVFPVGTAEAFYELQMAGRSGDAGAVPAFAARHPTFAAFAAWAGSAPWTGSYAETAFHGLNAFRLVDRNGSEQAVRWSLLPTANVTPLTAQALAALGPDHLAEEITQRVSTGPQRWRLVMTLAEPGDPTADASRQWPASRRTVEFGTVVVQRIEPERDGPCRDINFDPTILPDGIRLSDDPLPAARSAAYRRSYDLRTAEARHYPYQQPPIQGASR